MTTLKWQYRGPKRFVEYREAQGKTIKHLRYWHSPSGGQLVCAEFCDGTRVDIRIEPILKVEAEAVVVENGESRITKNYRTVVGSPVP